MVKRMGVRQVPWQSWAHWQFVADGIFSDSNDRIVAAQNRIKAWQSRGNVPISVETTAALTSIQQRDPRFNHDLPLGGGLPDDMLQMMYAMAVQRLVNGVVDVSSRRNISSVATRADSAGLPRLLVDIRHETAHNELPGLPLLQSASKQALEWLKVHYWDQQRQLLGTAREQIKKKLLAHCQLVVDILTPISRPDEEGSDDEGDENAKQRMVKVMRAMRNIHKHNLVVMKQERGKMFEELMDLCLSSLSDLVSILVDDGLLEQEVLPGQEDDTRAESDGDFTTGSFDLAAATYTAWRYTICKLSSGLPRLPAMLLVAIVKRIGTSRPISGPSPDSLGEGAGAISVTAAPADSPKENVGVPHNASGLNRLTAWCAWLLGTEGSEASNESISQEAVRSRTLGINRQLSVKADLNEDLCRELLRSSLYLSTERGPQVELVSLIALKVGSKKLQQQALMLAHFGSTMRRVSDVSHENNDDMETDSVLASGVASKPAASAGLPAGGETPGPDQSEQRERATTASHLDASNYEAVKRQQQEFFTKIVLERKAGRRLSLPSEDEEENEESRSPMDGDGRKSFKPSIVAQAGGRLGRKWTVAENWRPCALGMIPSPYNIIGVLPSLEFRLPEADTTMSVGHAKMPDFSSKQLWEVPVEDTAEDRVADCDTKASLLTSVMKRKSDGEPSSLMAEKRAKKADRHVQFSGVDDEKRTCIQSSPMKRIRASATQGFRAEHLPRGSLLQGCLRQHGQLMHFSPQQLESLKAAVHVL
ncbi:ribosomal biogenesis protein LAS1 [Marchantia polymorpha subsp. ruderalis]|uniref:Las1-like protein n=2 Tax=Marchantia polymorpha TaxID=3197 RepID=A0A176W600_MARPO|nr:hypothetical protein AXG93_115s1080 [Marchantia polymorpha subsp. ruderalis]PTQ43051.1 hypothetical protein MARPO_0027s0150 [Marchantia polymorpha]BBN10584.1 hypothetical protein Mp_5g04770 [Marchantia polymorpha subsp. ruderalis]|eukprot:PTQ43051.1 hypothetical protein MARPO_0027s0150 [Marchantia polymorpha]